MNEDVETVLARRVQECARGKHLPSDFSDRLVRSVRRRRRVSRVWFAISLTLIAALGMGLFGVYTSEEPKGTSEAVIAAPGRPSKSERVSGWMFIGFIRECFKRNKTCKKKEED